MKKLLLIAGLALIASGLFAQQQPAPVRQFMLIVRYPKNRPSPDAAMIESNGRHWGEFISHLAAKGCLVSALRPEDGGTTLSGKEMTYHAGPYSADSTVVSSFFLIRAANLDEATAIAKQCPIFELGGSVEIRAVTN